MAGTLPLHPELVGERTTKGGIHAGSAAPSFALVLALLPLLVAVLLNLNLLLTISHQCDHTWVARTIDKE